MVHTRNISLAQDTLLYGNDKNMVFTGSKLEELEAEYQVKKRMVKSKITTRESCILL